MSTSFPDRFSQSNDVTTFGRKYIDQLRDDLAALSQKMRPGMLMNISRLFSGNGDAERQAIADRMQQLASDINTRNLVSVEDLAFDEVVTEAARLTVRKVASTLKEKRGADQELIELANVLLAVVEALEAQGERYRRAAPQQS